jgi:RNA polymerase sigma-70 factor (ECF subfamily)
MATRRMSSAFRDRPDTRQEFLAAINIRGLFKSGSPDAWMRNASRCRKYEPMQAKNAARSPDLATLDDVALVQLARQRNADAFRIIMQRNNQRLYRVARSLLRDDSEAEDVVQQAYVNAFGSLDSFRGDASLPTWLTRITLNEALGRLRRQRSMVDLAVLDADSANGTSQVIPFPLMSESTDPERAVAQAQIRHLIERAIDDLPEIFRVVFVMRDVEDMSIEETADYLGLPPATVKTRLHRARRQLRRALDEKLASTLTEAFPFNGRRCQRTTDKVLQRLQLSMPPHS